MFKYIILFTSFFQELPHYLQISPLPLTCPPADIRHPSQVSTTSAFSGHLHFCPHSHTCDVSQLISLLLSFSPPVFSWTTCSSFAEVFQALQYFPLMSSPLWTYQLPLQYHGAMNDHTSIPVPPARTGPGCLSAQLPTARGLFQSHGDFLSPVWLKLANMQQH